MTNDNVPLIIFPGFIAFMAVGYIISTYNNFIKYRNRIEESWSSIDITLKRRLNLIPNLVEIVRGYEEHEAELLQKASHRFSENAGAPERMEEESRLSRSLNGLMAVAEGYPDLKASGNFLSLQQSLNEIEKEIQLTRNRYNIEVRKYNTLVESFPSLFIARKFGFIKKTYFTLELATQGDMLRVDFSDKDSAPAT
ncbi:MAG: LemA family protein [Proteobacteria bacterium]|nr:LemA family protein [Desulfobulbaceae bacterium]MBU4153243.1 LemA family protein [Pseudomonadota bacterium]